MNIEQLRKERSEKASKLMDLERLKFDPSELIAHKLIKKMKSDIFEIDKKLEALKPKKKSKY